MTARHATVAILLLSSVGCMSMQAVRSVPDYIGTTKPDLIWVTKAGNTMVIPVELPLMSGDTILGKSFGQPVAIPLAQAQLVEARQIDAKASTAFSVGVGLVLASAMIWQNGGEGAGVEIISGCNCSRRNYQTSGGSGLASACRC